MKSFTYILIVFSLILLEILVIPRFPILGVRPNLILLSVLGWFILTDEKEALKWLLPGGIILDFFSALPFGVISLSLFITLILISLIARRILGERGLGGVILISIIGSLIYNFCLLIFTDLFAFIHLSVLKIDIAYSLTYFILPGLLLNLVVMFILYRLLQKYYFWLTKIQ